MSGDTTGADLYFPGHHDPTTGGAIFTSLHETLLNTPRDSSTWNGLSNIAERIGYCWGRMDRYGQDGSTWYGRPGNPPETAYENMMTYECDAKLGNPRQTDCGHLRSSQLRGLSDTVSLQAGTVRFFDADTCSIGIFALASVTLTWQQVLAALDDLVEICVNNPLGTAVGGRAFNGRQAAIDIGRRRRRRKRRGSIALNALPPHVNISLFQPFERFPDVSNPAKEVQSCTWQKVLAHQDVRLCRGVHG